MLQVNVSQVDDGEIPVSLEVYAEVSEDDWPIVVSRSAGVECICYSWPSFARRKIRMNSRTV